MGGKAEAKERQQRAEGRRECCCVCLRCHSAAARFSGRRACRREESGKNGGEGDRKEGEKGSAWAALQLQQPVRKKEGDRRIQREGRESSRIVLEGEIYMYDSTQGEEFD